MDIRFCVSIVSHWIVLKILTFMPWKGTNHSNIYFQGSILSAYFWGAGMSQLLGGWLSDIYGGDNVLFWTCASWITITFSTPFVIRSSSLLVSASTMYLFLRFLLGLFQGAFPGAMASLLGKKLETAHKSSTNGMINSGACIG